MLTLPLAARQWINQDGQKIKADYVSSTATTVVLKLDGKDIVMGSISHAAQSYLPQPGSCGHFPGLELRDLKSGTLKDHKWGVISSNRLW